MAEEDEERLRSDLARLRSSLNKARGTRKPDTPTSGQAPTAAKGDSGLSLGLRAGSEFTSAVVIGAGVGWVIDRAVGTNPAFLIVFFFLGVTAGIWNVIRLTSPKGGGLKADSRLSPPEAPDKGVRRSAPEEPGALRGRPASRGANAPSGAADDDED
jgi:ATP synthase protein I